MLLTCKYCGFATEFFLHGVARDEIFISNSAWRFLNPKILWFTYELLRTRCFSIEIIAGISLEIPNVASFASLEVYLSEPLALLRISSGSETGVTGGPLGFALVLGLLEATLFQWIRQIDDYNQNSVQNLSIIKAGSMSSPREAELQSPLLSNVANLVLIQETPLSCSSRMPGNLNIFNGFLNGSS